MQDSGQRGTIAAMPSPRRIAFLAFEGVQTLDLTGPWEVLHSAGLLAERPYELIAATLDGEPVRSSSALELGVDARLGSIDRVDTLIVPGGSGTRAAIEDPALVSEVERLAAGARRVASVCTGTFLLAEAGLLDGRRAVTHWAACDLLAERYPSIDVDPDPIYVRDGNAITSAGVTAGIDLALALVEEDHGADVALEVARWLVVYARRPGGQAQFSVQLAHQAPESSPLRELQTWISEHPEEDLSVSALAGRMHLSERHFARLFAGQVGTSPAAYVEQVRVERARQLLEAGADGLERVAARCGFRSAEVMRRAFQRRVGTPPSAYRERFRVAA